MKPVLLVRNDRVETFGLAISALQAAGVDLRIVDATRPGESLPDLGEVSAVVMFGGTTNADEVHEHPFLLQDRELTREAVDREVPYLAYAATIAGGLYGLQNKIECPPVFEGNAYEAKDVPRLPSSLHEAVDEFEASKVAREAFGDFVFEHLLNTARQEQVIFDNQTVTDWELERYFERG